MTSRLEENRALFVVTSATTARAFLPSMVHALENQGFRVDVACAEDDEGGITFAPMHALPQKRSANPMAILRAAMSLARAVRDVRPDVLICATPVASLLGATIGRALRVPCVLHLAWGLRSESLTGLPRRAMRAVEAWTVLLAHQTLANSGSLSGELAGLTHNLGAVTCLGAGSSHGVDLVAFPLAQPSKTLPMRVGFVGRLRRDKGVFELLDAVEQVASTGRDLTLSLTGKLEDDAVVPAVERVAVAVINERTKDVAGLMAGIDVLCLPSWREGFPNVVLEAMATGRPVITTDATGARDSVIHGVTGLRVPVRNVAALKSALIQMYDHADARVQMGMDGRSWVEKDFDETQVCTNFAKFVRTQFDAYSTKRAQM